MDLLDDDLNNAFRAALRDFDRTPWPNPEDELVERIGEEPRLISLRWSRPICHELSSETTVCGSDLAKKSSRGWRCWYHWPDPAR